MAQEAFYLNTNLPVYVRAVNSDSFAGSVVQQGHALLYYNGTKLRAKLPSGAYIDVGGSSSTDFSIVTATPDDVLSPKQFYNNQGAPATGNIQTVTATLVGNTVHIPKGYIAASDSITVGGGGGDADVTLGVIDANGNFQKLKFTGTDASNSGSAQSVSSYYTWNSTLPAPAPTPGGSMNFYRCSYVNSDSWGGYKALFTSGVYSFQSNSTSGLTYSTVVPEVGKIYANGALVIATLYTGIPLTGLVFYAPLNASAGTAETGQTLTAIGDTITYATVSGIPCGQFNGNSALRSSNDSALAVGSTATLSMWLKMADTGNTIVAFQIGDTYSNYKCLNCAIRSRKASIGNQGQETSATTSIDTNWHHVAAICSGSSCTIYVDGTAIHSGELDIDVIQEFASIGSTLDSEDNFYEPFYGYLAAVRVYNRVLTALEIQTLATQFTPTT